METEQDTDAVHEHEDTPAITERDIVFDCPSCARELVVDQDGAGMEIPCPRCGHLLTIPAFQPPGAPDEAFTPVAPQAVQRFDFTGFSHEQLGRRMEELKHQLKENKSQETELRGHVNRAMMELHRLELKLRKLQERQADIEEEHASARAYFDGHSL